MHQTSPDGERLIESETRDYKRNATLLQGTLPDDMELNNKLFDKFCLQNPRIMLSVFVESGNKAMPLKLIYEGNSSPANEVIKLLYLGLKDLYGHYVYIKDFNRFLTNIDSSKGRKKIWCKQCQSYRLAKSKPCKHMQMRQKLGEIEQVFCCEKCMGTFHSAEDLAKHNHMCLIVDKNYRIVELPKERKYLEYNMEKSNSMTKMPTFMVADFESILVPPEDEEDDEEDKKTKTKITANHLPCSFGIITVSAYPELEDFHVYTGKSPEDTMEKFCDYIVQQSQKVYKVYCTKNPMMLTPEDRRAIPMMNECYICGKKLADNEKYRDHDHVTGKFLGIACNACNLKRALKYTELPLLFHNARGYDLHHIIKEITKKKYGCTFNGIAQNSEKIMSLTIKKHYDIEYEPGRFRNERWMCDIKILDSLLFLLKPLATLTEVAKKHHPDNLPEAFPYVFRELRKRGFTDEQIEASLHKIIYPYLWFDNFEKFEKPVEELDNLVRERKYEWFTDTVDEPFKQAFEKKAEIYFGIREKFSQIKTVKKYCELYLSGDVLQLACVIELARNTLFKSHHLDLLRYYGAPGFSWDAFLLHLKQNFPDIKPWLFKADEMNLVCFFMQAIRGGYSGIATRHA